jgi:hypothetical protein
MYVCYLSVTRMCPLYVYRVSLVHAAQSFNPPSHLSYLLQRKQVMDSDHVVIVAAGALEIVCTVGGPVVIVAAGALEIVCTVGSPVSRCLFGLLSARAIVYLRIEHACHGFVGGFYYDEKLQMYVVRTMGAHDKGGNTDWHGTPPSQSWPAPRSYRPSPGCPRLCRTATECRRVE